MKRISTLNVNTPFFLAQFIRLTGRYTIKGMLLVLLFLNASVKAQLVSTYYNFSQSSGTYVPGISTTSVTPADVFPTAWDDLSTVYSLPFDFTYNGVLYTAATGKIGVDSDGWLAFGSGTLTMTGSGSGGSWVSISDQTGVYLNGTANNNGFAGFNCDLNEQTFPTITGTLTSGSPTITGVSSVANIVVGTRLSGTGITNGTVVLSYTATTITLSANATANAVQTLTPRSSIYAFTRGVAPNRQFVVQWTQAKRYSSTGENINVQLILNEGNANPTLQTLQVVYGTCTATSATALNVQVGLRGAAATDFNARKSSTTWAANTQAAANTEFIKFNNTTNPATGLTFTWSPCTSSPDDPGPLSGTNPVCASSTATYSLAAVPGATTYNWSYSGTGATFTASTVTPSNTITFSAGATGGTLTVTPANLCGNGAPAIMLLTITPAPTATISYPAPSYCISTAGNIPVTQTGTAGGTYSTSPATGLTINASTGAVTPSSSTQGVYTVIYTFTAGSCTNTTSTTVSINPLPSVTATATPSTVCTGANSQLFATVNNTSNYSVISIPYSGVTPAGSPTVLWSTYTDDAQLAAALPFTFTYYGAAVNTINVSTNGFIELTTASGSSLTAQTLPNVTTPNNVIALSWRDLVVDPSSNPGAYVRHFVNGLTPNRVMVVEYYNLRFLGGTSQNVTGQIRLYESDNHIEVAVGTVNDNGSSLAKTLGIENSTGTLGVTPPGRNNVVWNVSSEAWAFYPPVAATYTYLWSPATYLSNTAISNPVASGVAGTISYNVKVTNNTTGCFVNTPLTLTVVSPLNGTYTVGVSGNYTTLTAAVNAYNNACLSGPVVFSLIDNTYPSETFPIVINSNSSASAVNTLTIKPAAAKTPLISGSNAIGIIKLNGADYITIDGSNTAGGTTRNLSLVNTSTNSTTSTIIWLASVDAANGATNNNIINCNFTGNSPTTTFTSVISSGSVVGAVAEAANNNNTYVNNLFIRAQTAIAVVGPSGNETGTIISGNSIGSATAGDKFGWSGIETYQQANCQVINNTIFGITSSSSSITTSGISVYGTANGITISGNKISDVKHTNTLGYGANGIYLGSSSTAANVNVYNNFVFDVAGYGYTGGRDLEDNGYGIIVDYGGGYNIYYNTVVLNTNQQADGYPAALNVTSFVTTAGSIILKNNILGNIQTQTGKHYAIQCTASNTVFASIDYNDYYISTTDLGYVGGANRTTLANIITGFGGNASSVNFTPVFISATDYHLLTSNAGNIASLKNKGTPIASILTDYDTQTRNGLTPDIGADEWVDPNYGSWVGRLSIDWLVPGNWEANYVPDATTDVFVTGGYTFMPTIITTQAVRNLSLSAPGVAPIITLNAGTLQVTGTITRTGGSINGSNGTLEMKGTLPQVIPASLFQNNNLKNLVISNTHAATGVTLAGPLDIYRSVSYGAGGLKLNTGDFLTFKSNAGGTAWLDKMTSSNILTGKATVERYIPLHTKAWQFLSTPITASSTQTVKQAWQDSATIANQNRYSGYGTQLTSNRTGAATQPTPGFDAFTAPGPSIKTFDRSSGGYTRLNRTDTAISNPRGYMVFVRGDRSVITSGAAATATVMRMKGTLHTPADPPVTINLPTPGFESIGNPYASAINYRLLTFGGGVQTDFFYMWDPKLTTLGVNSAWGLGGFQTFSWNGSAFDVVPGGGSYSGTNRFIESGQAFFVNAPLAAGTVGFTEACKVTGSFDVNRVPVVKGKTLRTNLNVISTGGRILLDGNLAGFHPTWSDNVDIADAVKLENTGENLGLYRNGKSLAIEHRSAVNRADTLFYRIGQMKIQQYELEFIPADMPADQFEAFLEDSYLHSSTMVSLRDTSRISFSITSDAGSAAPGRFYLVFRKLKKSKDFHPASNQTIADASRTQGFPSPKPADPGLTVFPNPVTGNSFTLQFINQEPGTYQLQIFNKQGQVVYTGSCNLNTYNGKVQVQLNEQLSKGVYQLSVISAGGNKSSLQVMVR